MSEILDGILEVFLNGVPDASLDKILGGVTTDFEIETMKVVEGQVESLMDVSMGFLMNF